jgi:hypothetical protein
MGRYHIDEGQLEEGDQAFDDNYPRSAKRNVDQPRRTPIRRKDKLREEEVEMKPKAKRNQKKIQNRLKYDWQGE